MLLDTSQVAAHNLYGALGNELLVQLQVWRSLGNRAKINAGNSRKFSPVPALIGKYSRYRGKNINKLFVAKTWPVWDPVVEPLKSSRGSLLDILSQELSYINSGGGVQNGRCWQWGQNVLC